MELKYSIILIIPCYNEQKRLDLNFYKAFLSNNSDIFLLFVDDGSKDNTIATIQSLNFSSSNIKILSLPKNEGKGESVRKGILHSLQQFEFDYIGFADADLSTPLTEFLHFRNKIQHDKNINIVLGSRIQMLGKNINRNLFRHWFGRIIATAIGKVLNEPVYDSQCGAKLFSKETARELFREKFISKWLFDVELLLRYKINHGSKEFKRTIIEMPVNEWTEKQNSKLRYHYFFRIMYDLMKIRNRYSQDK
ncbi:MAG: glycosyltransferase [Chitinophagaceae bacterium]